MLHCLIEHKGILMRLCWIDLRIITLIILKYLSAEMIISHANSRIDECSLWKAIESGMETSVVRC